MCRFQRVDQEARRKTTAPQTADTGHPVSLLTGLSPLVILGVASAIPLVPLLHHHPCPLDAPHTQSVQRRHTSANAVWSIIMRSTALALTAPPHMRTGVRVPSPLPFRPHHPALWESDWLATASTPMSDAPFHPRHPRTTHETAVPSDVLLLPLRHPPEMVTHSSDLVSPLSPCLGPRCTTCLGPEIPMLTGWRRLHHLRATRIKVHHCAFIIQGENRSRKPNNIEPRMYVLALFCVCNLCTSSSNVNFVSKCLGCKKNLMALWSFKKLCSERWTSYRSV